MNATNVIIVSLLVLGVGYLYYSKHDSDTLGNKAQRATDKVQDVAEKTIDKVGDAADKTIHKIN